MEALCELYPGSPVYTLFYEKGKVSDEIARHPIRVSRLQKFPFIFKFYRNYLPFFTSAIESFGLVEADLVVSTSHCVAKGIRKKQDSVHVCYCFTPVRYVWGLFEEYFGRKDPLSRAVIGFFLGKLKTWDLEANARVDHFIAISDHVRQRIRRCYGRSATVVYPPVDTEFYCPDRAVGPEDFYLIVSALVPYKRIDVAIRAFNRLGRRLIVIGDGPDYGPLRRIAGKNVSFLGWQPARILRDHYRSARALVFPGEEDFGIVPVEAQACGGAVIALRRGGALETVTEGETGIFFDELSVEAIEDAVRRFEAVRLDPRRSRENAERFSKARFQFEMKGCFERFLSEKGGLKP